jgi:hypothetical protein
MNITTKLSILALPSALLASMTTPAHAELSECLHQCELSQYECEEDAGDDVDAYNQCANEELLCSDACWDQYI